MNSKKTFSSIVPQTGVTSVAAARSSSSSSSKQKLKFHNVRQMNLFTKKKLDKEAERAEQAAAALAKMAGKKKKDEVITFQIEVEDESQWRNLLRREGLIVVDVYAGWAGPCASMLSILKRVKVEVNDDRLWMAIARSDDISDLLMFKDQSEPTWLFIGGGKPVKVFRGANAPKLIKLIKDEFAQEAKCMAGKAKRNLVSIDDENTRRKKAENEATKLASMIKDESDTSEKLNEMRTQSSVRLMDAVEPYTILVVQNYLLTTGAVTEVKDSLQGEFKIEQERYVTLDERAVRHLFRIPHQIPDPNWKPEPSKTDVTAEGEEAEVKRSSSEVKVPDEPLGASASSASIRSVQSKAPIAPGGAEGQKEGGEGEEGAEAPPPPPPADGDLDGGEEGSSGATPPPPPPAPAPTEAPPAPPAGDDDDDTPQPPPPPPKKKKEAPMINVPLPEGLTGETLFMLIECNEVMKLIKAGLRPSKTSPLSTADDYIQVKVGPVHYKDAIEHAPHSMHAVYGKGDYVCGVWCPRRYDDKRHAMLYYFPHFVTETLMPPPKGTPKYMLAVFPAEFTNDVTRELKPFQEAILAEGKVKIAPQMADKMLKSWNKPKDEEYETKKKALTQGNVYALSVDRKNSALMLALAGLDPLHISADSRFGKIESGSLFKKLEIDTTESSEAKEVLQKFMARSKPRIKSDHAFSVGEGPRAQETEEEADIPMSASAVSVHPERRGSTTSKFPERRGSATSKFPERRSSATSKFPGGSLERKGSAKSKFPERKTSATSKFPEGSKDRKGSAKSKFPERKSSATSKFPEGSKDRKGSAKSKFPERKSSATSKFPAAGSSDRKGSTKSKFPDRKTSATSKFPEGSPERKNSAKSKFPERKTSATSKFPEGSPERKNSAKSKFPERKASATSKFPAGSPDRKGSTKSKFPDRKTSATSKFPEGSPERKNSAKSKFPERKTSATSKFPGGGSPERKGSTKSKFPDRKTSATSKFPEGSPERKGSTKSKFPDRKASATSKFPNKPPEDPKKG